MIFAAKIAPVTFLHPGPKLPGGMGGGGGGVIHPLPPPQARESSSRRANDSKSSGQFLQIKKN